LIGILLMGNSGCVTSHNPPKKIEALREWHGSKQDCIDFLNGPMAQSERWEVLAIGE
jgi:hypothetical protein